MATNLPHPRALSNEQDAATNHHLSHTHVFCLASPDVTDELAVDVPLQITQDELQPWR
jgi:hypothetical protein